MLLPIKIGKGMIGGEMTIEQKIKRLKRDFERNILPSLKRHSHHVGKSEMRRMMVRRAIKKIKRRTVPSALS